MVTRMRCFPETGLPVPVFEDIEMESIEPIELDHRLAEGWRHFGTRFFRYNFAFHDGVLCGVLPLRIRLDRFSLSKSQRRLVRRNADVDVRHVPAKHCAEYDELFERHRTRFVDNVPDSLRDFLSPSPDHVPCTAVASEFRLAGRLVAVSFLDIGSASASSVYACFDPEFSERGLGNFSLLVELEYARERGCEHLYLGYAYTVPSVYDYKLRFAGLEAYDWGHGWIDYPGGFRWSRSAKELETAS